MSAAVMTAGFADASPHSRARAAGVFYLLTIIFGISAVLIEGRLVVSGNAAATASNIVAHESLFRLVFVFDLIATLCYVVVTALLYEMFKAVNRSVSLVAAFVSLAACAVSAASCVAFVAPLSLLKGAEYAKVFTPEQLQALAVFFLRLRGLTANVSMAFFGVYCILIGYLVFRSTFMPRVIGVLMAIAGLGWLTFLWPPLSSFLWPWTGATGLLGEGSLTVWLLLFGNGHRGEGAG